MNILFICTANIHRSRTAEDYYREKAPSHQYKSAGLSEKECVRNGSTLCTVEMLKWADIVYVFEPNHLIRIREHTGNRYDSKLQCLHIDDIYQYMQSELIDELDKLYWPFIGKP